MTPVLYILMRTDLPSMNAGKAMAQASHASNKFVKMMEGDLAIVRSDMARRWQEETDQGFGTVLVLAVDDAELAKTISKARENNLAADFVTDPTYPYRVQGEIALLIPVSIDTVPRSVGVEGADMVTLYRSEITCGFVFGDKDGTAGQIVSHLKLHP